MAATNQTAEQRSWSQKKRKRLGPPDGSKAYTATAELKAEIVRLLGEGATTREICELPTMPARATLFEWLDADPAFREVYEKAKISAANVIVDEAMDYAREAVEHDGEADHARAKTAESYANVAIKYAQCVAPRQFGQLVKLGNETGDGPAVLQIISYASKTLDGQGVVANGDEPKKAESGEGN
jgi:hypothetical protein